MEPHEDTRYFEPHEGNVHISLYMMKLIVTPFLKLRSDHKNNNVACFDSFNGCSYKPFA